MSEDKPIRETDFVVVDVETTGMSSTEDRITEIAMMHVRDGTLVDEFSTLVNPLMTIPAFITDLTGIDNIMVQDAPTAREVVPYMAEFLGDSVFVAHNAPFDWGFVSQTARRERGIELTNPQLCTVRLSRKILPDLPSKSLGPVSKYLDIRIPERHRASGDAYATALVLIKYLSFLRKRFALQTIGELLRFQSTGRLVTQ
ncbi:MAG TPA: exonuclease domain-containing protein [Bacteroidota bacterium]|nr:exonuclease domain-containing protein [Bacteroidota bacterium]